MAEKNLLQHIKIEKNPQSDIYKGQGGGKTIIKKRQRGIHGRKIQKHLEKIKLEFDVLKDKDLPRGIVRDDAIYVEFLSEFDFKPAFDSFASDAKNTKFELLSIKKELLGEKVRYRINVMLIEGGISHFLSRVEDYISSKNKHTHLVSNLQSIQLASLKGFWSEPDNIPFPNEDEIFWWEVWFRRKTGVDLSLEYERISTQLQLVDAQIAETKLLFPEHFILLVKASPNQLSESIFLLDNLAELRKPKETAEFFSTLTISEKEDAIAELKSRIQNQSNNDSLAICILDSGVQRQHPLLVDFISEDSMLSYKPDDWGASDIGSGITGGHGTGMAGLALYGDLTNSMSSIDNIQIYHQIESVKIINKPDPHEPELYGAVSLEAVNAPLISNPFRPRIYCMAVTAKDFAYYGRPSSWSTSLDMIAFGNEDEDLEKQLFIVSSGNVVITAPEDFPDKNTYESVHDPAQAFNTITVGAFTEKDVFDVNKFPNSELLSEKGGMSPSNSTSIFWENDWPIKPDVVFEGGNLINQNGDIVKPDSLQLLTTHKNFRSTLLQTFGETSAATALASRFAAQLMNVYPDLWPETIRALMIHSANWTSTMLNGKTPKDVAEDFNQKEKKNLLRSYGYGVPNLEKAMYSAQNSLTLIAEKKLTPFKKEGGVKFNEIHYYELPWPTEVLQDYLSEVDVKLNITLSYFIEPNPGNRQYSTKFSYQSHGLGFNVIKPDEDEETFQKRVNKNARDKGEKGFSGESWAIGEKIRNKGSIHRDFWIGSGADLATRNRIAVYPIYGWYKRRKKLEKFDSEIRYSLIVTIETPDINVDIYTPVKNLITIEV